MLDPKVSQVYGPPREYPPSLWHALKPKFDQHPNAPAVFALHQKADHLRHLVDDDGHTNGHTNGHVNGKKDCLEWSFQQLDRASTRVAAAIYKGGIKPEATMVTFVPNGIEWCLLNVSSMKAKLNFTALDLGALEALRSDDLNHFWDLLCPEIVVVADIEAAKIIDDLTRADHEPILKLLIEAEETPKGWMTLTELAAESDAASQVAVVKEALDDDLERICVTMFTSGTSSGKPKGCPRNVVSMLHQLDHTERAWNEDLSRRLVDTANFRAIAQGHALCSWYEGGAFVMSGRTASPEGAIKAIERFQVTDLILIPAMVRMIRNHPDYTPEKVASVRTCASGGDVITRAVIEIIEETFPNARGTNAHGMTETAKFFRALNYLDSNSKGEPRYRDDVVSNGTVAPGVKLKVVLDGKVVPRGTPGELEVGSYHTARRYLQNVSSDTFYKDGDGHWMKTGDTAIIDEDGYIFIVGRSKDIIKRAGVPVVPSALESALQPFVNTEAVVFGVEHPIYGAEPWVVLGSFNDKTEADVKQHILDKFGRDYALGGAVSLADLNMTAIPLNSTGKIQKLELKKALVASLDAKKVTSLTNNDHVGKSFT